MNPAALRVLAWTFLGLAFLPTLLWAVDGWLRPEGWFEHGPLLVLAGLWFLHERRGRITALPRLPAPRATAVLAALLLVHFAAQLLQVDSLSGLVVVPAVAALFWALEGPARLRPALAPIGCFLFAIPLPMLVTGRLAYELKHLATGGAVVLGNLLGLGLTQEGARIWIAGVQEPLLVGDACSGLRSLTALVALGYVYACFLSRRGVGGKALLVALAVPIALGANFVRIAALALLARGQGMAFATGTAHDVSGYAIYVAAALVLFAADRLLPGARPAPPARAAPPAPGDGAPPAPVPAAAPRTGAILAVLCALGLPALWLGFDRPGDPVDRLGPSVPSATKSFRALRDLPLSDRWYGLLGTHDVVWREFEHVDSRRRLVLTIVFHGRNWKAVHPPETCLAASGYEVRARSIRGLPGRDEELAVLESEHRGGTFLSAYLYGGRDFRTPRYTTFVLANLPAALLRRDTRGYLLRVDLEVGDLERAAAEALLAAFLAEMLPELDALLR
ncbi:MAG: exosortase/archaeosortase family protein [Planctomycetota bacterium]